MSSRKECIRMGAFGISLLQPIPSCPRSRHWLGTLGRAPAPCVCHCSPCSSPLFGVARTPRNCFGTEGQEGLGRAWLRGQLCHWPGLDLLLGQSLPGWASGWEQGHAIRLSAELFILGRRAGAGKGVGARHGTLHTNAAESGWAGCAAGKRVSPPCPELLLGCASGADGGKR